MTTPVSSMVYVLGGSVIGSVGAAFLKSGALVLHGHWSRLFVNWRLGIGIGAYLLSSIFFLKGVSNGELSVLYPMVSLGYICTLAWSRIFFNETLTFSKCAGVGLILVGIVFLGIGNSG